jgi:hypothetical protein
VGGEQGKDEAALERLLAFMDAELRRLARRSPSRDELRAINGASTSFKRTEWPDRS